MAASTYADFIDPQLWQAYVQSSFVDKAVLLASRAVTKDGNPPFAKAGIYNNIPFYKKISQDIEKPTAATDLTIRSITTDKDIMVCLHRALAFGEEQNAARRSGGSGVKDALNSMSKYIAEQMDKYLYKLLGAVSLAGGALASLSTSHINDQSGGTISHTDILDTKSVLADNSDAISILIMHSKVFQDYRKSALVEYVDASVFGYDILTKGRIPTVDNMEIVITDMVTKTGNVYDTYLLGFDSLYFANPFFKVKLWEDVLLAGGTDIGVINTDFCVHAPQIKFVPASETNPTDATLALAATWSSVANSHKEIKIATLKTL